MTRSRPRLAAHATAAAAVVAALGAGACLGISEPDPEPGPECVRDDDCPGECTNPGICVPAGTSLYLRILWTIGGVAPTPAAPGPCEGIVELEVAFLSGDRRGASYRPVTCSLGQITFDRLPPDYDAVTVIAYDGAGSPVDEALASIAPGAPSPLRIDLQP